MVSPHIIPTTYEYSQLPLRQYKERDNEVGSGVKEIRISDDSGAFRIMYVAKFMDKIYVLHSFQKKSQKTSTKDIKIAKTRYSAIINQEKL